MADLKKHMHRHLRSARQWLTRAEESFGNDREVRGELDLILAQAELQHAREAGSIHAWNRKYPWLNHAVVLSLSLMFVAVGFGGAFWLMRDRAAVPAPLVKTQVMPPPPAQVPQPVPEPVRIQEKSPVPAAITPQSAASHAKPGAEGPSAEERSVRQPAQEFSLPPSEMQKLIQAAGKSLRGN